MILRLSASILYSIFLISACAFDLANVKYQPTQFIAVQDVNKIMKLKDNVSITGASCYERTLRKWSKWQLTGSTKEGDVYKPLDQILTLECSNVHEAYLVVAGRDIVGFYLPVEKGFVNLSERISLPIE